MIYKKRYTNVIFIFYRINYKNKNKNSFQET